MWTKKNPGNSQLNPLFLTLSENFQSNSRDGVHILHGIFFVGPSSHGVFIAIVITDILIISPTH